MVIFHCCWWWGTAEPVSVFASVIQPKRCMKYKFLIKQKWGVFFNLLTHIHKCLHGKLLWTIFVNLINNVIANFFPIPFIWYIDSLVLIIYILLIHVTWNKIELVIKFLFPDFVCYLKNILSREICKLTMCRSPLIKFRFWRK
jgi:hypothetical protein